MPLFAAASRTSLELRKVDVDVDETRRTRRLGALLAFLPPARSGPVGPLLLRVPFQTEEEQEEEEQEDAAEEDVIRLARATHK